MKDFMMSEQLFKFAKDNYPEYFNEDFTIYRGMKVVIADGENT